MAPRKAARSSAGATPSALPPLPHSAARETFHIPELRQRILRLVAPADLTRVMRIERGVMGDVAKELYYSMPYAHVKNRMTMSTPRQRTYCNAVTEIDARDITLSSAMMKGIKVKEEGKATPTDIFFYLHAYHVEVMELLLPILQKKCPNLRRILFGLSRARDHADSWTVQLDPAHPGTGHIDLRCNLTQSMQCNPGTRFRPLPAAPQGFTIERRLNMRLCSAIEGYEAEWFQAFKDTPYLADLGETVNFGPLAVSLEDISGLYRRQVDSGSTCRMTDVCAERCLPYSVSDLNSFAKLASASLTRLQLVEIYTGASTELQHSLSFADLPELSSVIRSLPKLVSLTMTLKGSAAEGRTAEVVCKEFMSERCLETGGSIKEFRIVTEAHAGPYFNTLRCLSELCDAEGEGFSISVGPRGKTALGQDQANFVQYLRKQSRERRSHLAVADFPQLGYAKLAEISELSCHDDGRPRHKAETSVARWAKEAQNAAVDVPSRLIPRLEDAVSDYAKASAELEGVMAEGSTADRLEAAQKFMNAAIYARLTATVVQASMAGPKTVEQVREYIASLKRITEAS